MNVHMSTVEGQSNVTLWSPTVIDDGKARSKSSSSAPVINGLPVLGHQEPARVSVVTTAL